MTLISRQIKSMDSTDMIMKSSGNSTPVEDSINVVVRVRPLNEKEKKTRDESIIQFPGNGQILVSNNIHHLEYRIFKFKTYSARAKRLMDKSQNFFHIMLCLSLAPFKR